MTKISMSSSTVYSPTEAIGAKGMGVSAKRMPTTK